MNLSLKHTVYTILVSTDEHAICISNQATTDSFLTLVKRILIFLEGKIVVSMKYLLTGIITWLTDKIIALKILLSHFVLTCRHEPLLHAVTVPFPSTDLKQHSISFRMWLICGFAIPKLFTNGTPFPQKKTFITTPKKKKSKYCNLNLTNNLGYSVWQQAQKRKENLTAVFPYVKQDPCCSLARWSLKAPHSCRTHARAGSAVVCMLQPIRLRSFKKKKSITLRKSRTACPNTSSKQHNTSMQYNMLHSTLDKKLRI